MIRKQTCISHLISFGPGSMNCMVTTLMKSRYFQHNVSAIGSTKLNFVLHVVSITINLSLLSVLNKL